MTEKHSDIAVLSMKIRGNKEGFFIEGKPFDDKCKDELINDGPNGGFLGGLRGKNRGSLTKNESASPDPGVTEADSRRDEATSWGNVARKEGLQPEMHLSRWKFGG
jgi:hypothetical protein